jgi:hypothetical protein
MLIEKSTEIDNKYKIRYSRMLNQIIPINGAVCRFNLMKDRNTNYKYQLILNRKFIQTNTLITAYKTR